MLEEEGSPGRASPPLPGHDVAGLLRPARILLESIEVLDRLGMTAAAMACSYVAQEEGLLPPA
ncbi:hypothetical protein [Streptomyces longispororuber]|uniref:hypothetical protein n=1 Tax=Streptomyces longispororuber TaxID=68230 RepID=UPI00167E77C4|nr:hypothetical protein [Streptomyces longispororuber]